MILRFCMFIGYNFHINKFLAIFAHKSIEEEFETSQKAGTF